MWWSTSRVVHFEVWELSSINSNEVYSAPIQQVEEQVRSTYTDSKWKGNWAPLIQHKALHSEKYTGSDSFTILGALGSSIIIHSHQMFGSRTILNLLTMFKYMHSLQFISQQVSENRKIECFKFQEGEFFKLSIFKVSIRCDNIVEADGRYYAW